MEGRRRKEEGRIFSGRVLQFLERCGCGGASLQSGGGQPQSKTLARLLTRRENSARLWTAAVLCRFSPELGESDRCADFPRGGGYRSIWNVFCAVVRNCKAVEDNRSPGRWRDCGRGGWGSRAIRSWVPAQSVFPVSQNKNLCLYFPGWCVNHSGISPLGPVRTPFHPASTSQNP